MSSELSVHVHGKPAAPALVLVHGVTDAGTTWPDAVTHWSDDWQLHAVSLRGHGTSPRFSEEQAADMMGTHTADLLAVLEGFAEPPVVIGHSLGGRTAVLTALQRPDLVRALVLEDPALMDTTPQRRREMRLWIDGIKDFATRKDTEIARQVAAGWSVTEAEAWAESKLQVDLRMMELLDFGPMDRDTVLDGLTVPTLVVAPADSIIVPAPGHVTNEKVRMELLDGVGHCVRRDDPERWFRLVDAFLAHLP